MSTFQLFLLILSASVFYMFFKQLFSGSYPKRGLDFEAKNEDEQIGGINHPEKIFSHPDVEPTRMEQLLSMADDAIEKEDFEEAKKALGSALILDADNIDALQKMGYVCMHNKEYQEAKENFEKLIVLDADDDMAHDLLANALHQLGKNEEAYIHHEKAIELDAQYAPHYFNYANTLYDLGKNEEALAKYKKAYELDNTIKVAKEMIDKLGGHHE